MLVQQRRRVLEQPDDAAVVVHDVELDVAHGATLARRHLQRQLVARHLAAVHVEEPEAGRTLAVRRGHRGVLPAREPQRRGERRVHLDRAALGVERDADADRDHGEQRLELGHPIAQLAVRPGQALFAGAPDAGQLQGGADARGQLAGPERLQQIVVGAGLEPGDARLLAGARRDEDHGQVPQRRVGADRPQQLQAVQARHHHVGEQQVGRLAPQGGERGHAVADRLDAAGRGEQAGHVVAHVGVVVGDDDARTRRPRVGRLRGAAPIPAASVTLRRPWPRPATPALIPASAAPARRLPRPASRTGPGPES